jgi:KaiC/GvpD/RAD55 family RecA-like ATPase
VVVDVVTGGAFGRLAGEVLERLGRDGLVVLVGPHGVGKSTLAAYVAWLALWRGAADAVVSAGEVKTGFASSLENLQRYTGRRFLLLYDPVPVTAYYEPSAVGEEAEKEKERVRRAVGEALRAAGSGVKTLVALPDELYRDLPPEAKETLEKYVVKAVLKDVEFLHSVIKTYSSCEGDYSKLAEEIAQFNGGYTLVAKYAGLWLRERGCDAGDVERAVEEAKQEPKLFFAHYIWHVLLRGSGDLAMQAAVPLLLHAHFGRVPVGVTYVTKAVDEGDRWRLSTPEGLEGADLQSLKKDALEPIANWLAQLHEDLVEEVLKDLAGLNGEKARELYKEALSDLIKALDWARNEVLKEVGKILAKLSLPEDWYKVVGKILAELGVPERDWGLWISLPVFVCSRLVAVFRGSETKHCWKRAALIAGHALAGRTVLSLWEQLPKDIAKGADARGAGRCHREQLREDVAEALGDALKSCAVDAYLTTDGKIPPLSILVAQLASMRELNILSPFADTETIKAAKKTAEDLLARWRRRGFHVREVFYALGLAVLAAGAEVDEKTANLLLNAASTAVQEVAYTATVLPVLTALRPLGDKAPHRYVEALAAASELETLGAETAWYIYDSLQQLSSRLHKTEYWPLVEAIRAYSNLLTKHFTHIVHRLEDAVADMCQLHREVGTHGTAAALDSGSSAQRLLNATARAHVLAAALRSDVLALLVQRHCNLGDLVKEAEAVRSALEEAAARPEELRKISISDEDFAELVTARSPTGDAERVIENLRAWFTYVLARHKLDHALNDRGELDTDKLEEAAKEFEKAADMSGKLEDCENYLTTRSPALRARVLAAKSWEELLDKAMGFQVLWDETTEYRKPTARYLAAAAASLGEYIVYLAASGDRKRAEELLREWRWLLDYDREVSVVTRLMLKLFGVGEGAKLEEVVEAFWPWLSPEFRPALLMLTGRLQRDEALEKCAKLSKTKDCMDAVAATASNQTEAEVLRSAIEKVVPEAHPLLDKADGRTLVEVLAPRYSHAQLAFMLLTAVEGRTDAIRLQVLWGSAWIMEPLLLRLLRAVYENCGDLNSEGCKMALLKLYYYHY